MPSTAKSYDHFSYQQLGAFVRSATEKHGAEVFDNDSFEVLTVSTSTVAIKHKHGGIETIFGRFDFSSDAALLASPIVKIEHSVNDQGAWAWEGEMTVQNFLNDNWPNEQQFGNESDNLMETYSGSPVIAGAGNDFIVFNWGGEAAGGEGNDAFILRNRGGYSEAVVLDYQHGDKILFPEFTSTQALVSSVTALRFTENGFAIDFTAPTGPWSVVFANLEVNQLREEDIRVGDNAWIAMQPLIEAFGSKAVLQDWLF